MRIVIALVRLRSTDYIYSAVSVQFLMMKMMKIGPPPPSHTHGRVTGGDRSSTVRHQYVQVIIILIAQRHIRYVQTGNHFGHPHYGKCCMFTVSHVKIGGRYDSQFTQFRTKVVPWRECTGTSSGMRIMSTLRYPLGSPQPSAPRSCRAFHLREIQRRETTSPPRMYGRVCVCARCAGA